MRKQIHSGSCLSLLLPLLVSLWTGLPTTAQVTSFEFFKHTWHRDHNQTRYTGSVKAEWFYYDRQSQGYKALGEHLKIGDQTADGLKFKLRLSDLKLNSGNSYRYKLKLLPDWIGPSDCFQMLDPRVLSLEPPHSPAEIFFIAKNLPKSGGKEIYVDFTIINNTYQNEHIAVGVNNRVRIKKSFVIRPGEETPVAVDSSGAKLKADVLLDGRMLHISNIRGGQKPYLLALIKKGAGEPAMMLELPDSISSYSLDLKTAKVSIGRYDLSILDATRENSLDVENLAIRNSSGRYLGGLLLVSLAGMFACIFVFLRREKVR